MNTSIDPQAVREVEARELRLAAIHEAAHAAIIRRFGGLASPTVWRNASGAMDEKAWLGTCHMTALPGQVKWNRGGKKLYDVQKPPKRWTVYVGLAGFVAEQIDLGECDEYVVHDYLMLAADLSQSDVTLMTSSGRFPTPREVAVTMHHLLAVWPMIITEASLLMDVAPLKADPRP